MNSPFLENTMENHPVYASLDEAPPALASMLRWLGLTPAMVGLTPAFVASCPPAPVPWRVSIWLDRQRRTSGQDQHRHDDGGGTGRGGEEPHAPGRAPPEPEAMKYRRQLVAAALRALVPRFIRSAGGRAPDAVAEHLRRAIDQLAGEHHHDQDRGQEDVTPKPWTWDLTPWRRERRTAP